MQRLILANLVFRRAKDSLLYKILLLDDFFLRQVQAHQTQREEKVCSDGRLHGLRYREGKRVCMWRGGKGGVRGVGDLYTDL